MDKPNFPLPPKPNNRTQGLGGPTYVAPPIPPQNESVGPPQPPPIDTVNGRLNEDETHFILQSSLIPEHREDPNILRFIANYMRCRDARQAASEAGLNPRSGPNLRGRPDIHAAITRLSEKSVLKYGFDASEVIEKVKEIANIDPADFLNEDGSYKTNMRDIPPESRRAVKKFKAKNLYERDPNGMMVVVGQLIEVEFWDKMKASELLGREKEVFKEKKIVEHDIGQNMGAFLLESAKRADQRLIGGETPIDVTPIFEDTDESK